VAPLVCAAAIARAFARRDRDAARRFAWPLAATALAYVAVYSQGKFFVYHYALLVLPFAHLAATVYAELAPLTATRARAVAVASIAPALLAGSIVAMTPTDVWLRRVGNAFAWMAGRMSSDELRTSFSSDYIDLDSAGRVAAWLRERAAPGDELLVRGYEPEVYTLARMRWGGRFMFTAALVDPKRAYRRAEWLAEDSAQVDARAPRWAVAFDGERPELDTPVWLERRGFTRRASFGAFVVLERAR
jgi:hypothetical protein